MPCQFDVIILSAGEHLKLKKKLKKKRPANWPKVLLTDTDPDSGAVLCVLDLNRWPSNPPLPSGISCLCHVWVNDEDNCGFSGKMDFSGYAFKVSLDVTLGLQVTKSAIEKLQGLRDKKKLPRSVVEFLTWIYFNWDNNPCEQESCESYRYRADLDAEELAKYQSGLESLERILERHLDQNDYKFVNFSGGEGDWHPAVFGELEDDGGGDEWIGPTANVSITTAGGKEYAASSSEFFSRN